MSASSPTGVDPRTTILVLHPTALDPRPYVHSLIVPEDTAGTSQKPLTSETKQDKLDDDATPIPWSIDNKYYQASVTIRCFDQDDFEQSLADDVEVVVYLFTGYITSLPPSLVRVMAEPRDIAIAVRIPDPEEPDLEPGAKAGIHSDNEEGIDSLEDMFDELGMEFLDECLLENQEEDERPVPIIEQVRQTLMTHMWPNMIRKPLSNSTRGIDEDLSTGSPLAAADDLIHSELHSAFPTSFESSADTPFQAGPSNISLPSIDGSTEFPGVDELRSQIMLEDTERMGEFSRLDMLDQDDDWVQAEYSRLDDWLEADEDEEGNLDITEDEDQDPSSVSTHRSDAQQGEGEEGEPSVFDRLPPDNDESQFEDDFADFAPFQSGPPATSTSSNDLPLDPTPLLLHLQNVREELVGLDEDTRRKRAGQEVETLLRSLGLGGLDWEEDELAALDVPASSSSR